MRNVSKILVCLLILAMASPLAACGGTKSELSNAETSTSAESASTATAEKIELEFSMIANANEIDGWTTMIDAANLQLTEKNINIKVTKVPAQGWSEYYQKLVAQMAAGSAPDVGRIAESFMPQIVAKEQAVDLTNYISELDMSLYYESTFKSAGYKNGKYYGIPSGVYYMLMYYNKDLFDLKSLQYPSGDWNNAISFDMVKEYAKKLTSGEGANKNYGFYAGPYMSYIGAYSLSAGGKNVFNEDGTSAMNSPITKSVYKWFDTMLQVDKSMPRPTDTKIMDAFTMFKSGRLAMVVDGTWMLGAMKDIKDFKVGIAAVPSGSGKAYSSQFVDSFFILKGTKHEKAAWEALKAVISKASFDALASTGVGGTPVNKESVEKVKEAMLSTFTKENLDCLSEGLNHTVSVPYNEFYDQVDQKVNAAIDEWLLGKITSDQFADKVNQYVTEGAQKAAN